MSNHLLQELRQELSAPPTIAPILSHASLVATIANALLPLDWRQVAQVGPNSKVLNKHYQLFTVKRLLEYMQSIGRSIRVFNGQCYLFNGAFWKPIAPDALKRMLVKAALAFGMPEADAELAEFGDKLLAQLYASAEPIEIPVNKSVVKIPFLNGTLTIARGREAVLDTFDAEDFIRYQLPYNYDPKATCPAFDKFLGEVQPDESCRKVMAEWLGNTYVPTSFLGLEKIMFFTGSGSNGKSVVLEITRALLGAENVSSYTLEGLTTKADQRAGIANKLLNYAGEISKKQDSTYFKTLASGEPVDARHLYADSFTMTDYAKLQFNCNRLPDGVEHNHGFFRRFLIVPFNQTIGDAQKELGLAKRIIATELPGVFNWALAGLVRLIENEAFTLSNLMAAQVEEYQMDHDSAMQFVKSSEGYESHESNKILLKDMFKQFQEYCREWGLPFAHVSGKAFKKRLAELGIKAVEKPTNAGVAMLASRKYFAL